MTETEATIEFVIILNGGERLSEGEALKHLAENPKAFDLYSRQEGQLVLTHGGAQLLLDDVLGPLCLALVRDVIPKLAATGAARVMARASDLDMDFSLDADTVIVTTDVDPAFTMPRAGFEAAARGVAQRFCDLAIQIWPDDPQAIAFKGYMDSLAI